MRLSFRGSRAWVRVAGLGAAAVAVSIALGAVGCKKEDLDADKPLDDCARESLLLEQQKVARGEPFGAALAAPKIVVDANDIRVNGVRVAPRAELDTPHDAAVAFAGGIDRIVPLFARLRGLREHWKAIFPGRDSHFEADVTIEGELTAKEGQALLASIAFAGYPTLTVRTRGILVAFEHWYPGPPNPDRPPDPPRVVLELATPDPNAAPPDAPLDPPIYFRVAPTPPDWTAYHEIDRYQPWAPAWAPATTHPPGFWQVCTPGRRIELGALEAAIADACKSGCGPLDIEAQSNMQVRAPLELVARAGAAGKTPFARVRFIMTDDACREPPRDPMPAPIPNGLAAYKSLALQITPIDPIASTALPQLRGCYAEALEVDPRIDGRVVVELAIDESGAATQGHAAVTRFSFDGPAPKDPNAAARALPSLISCIVHAFRPLLFGKNAAPGRRTFAVDLAHERER